MVKGVIDIVPVVQGQQERRCSKRRTRSPLEAFPRYFGEGFTEITYNFLDGNGSRLQGSMGDRMEVILLPNAFADPGSAPGQDQLEPITMFLRAKYPQFNFIKGHMWNQELGGRGETKNLVPLTSAANSSHKNNVEQPLKNALRDFANFYINNKSDHPDYDKVYGFRYVVEIENAAWSDIQERIVPNSIHAQVFPIKYNISGDFSFDNSIIYDAVSSSSRGQIEELSNGIWIDQNGEVYLTNPN